MNKKTTITILFALVAVAGQGQVKCHVEGTLETDAWGDEIIICEAGTDLRVVDSLPKAYVDSVRQVVDHYMRNESEQYTAFHRPRRHHSLHLYRCRGTGAAHQEGAEIDREANR